MKMMAGVFASPSRFERRSLPPCQRLVLKRE